MDLAGIEIQLEVKRFEQDLMALDTAFIENHAAKLQRKYPEFYNLYMEQIMRFKPVGDSTNAYLEVLSDFISNAYIRGLNDSVQRHFASLEKETEQLESALRHFNYYFPEKPIPSVVTFISEFGYGVITYDTILVGIGLDMYLGSGYRYYDQFFPAYLVAKLTPAKMLPDVMKALYSAHFGDKADPSAKLVYAMIDEGKKAYFTSCMLPDIDEHLLFGFTEEQLRWCELSEQSIWEFMVDNDLVFSDNPDDKRKFLTEGPTTPGMPAEAPGNIGLWIGYRIVSKYMDQGNQDRNSLRQLITETSSQEVYQSSGYRPK